MQAGCTADFEAAPTEHVGFGNAAGGDQNGPSSFCTEQTRGERGI